MNTKPIPGDDDCDSTGVRHVERRVVAERAPIPFAVAYAQLTADTTGFVFSSWMESHHQGDPKTRAIPFTRYKGTQRGVITQALDRGRVIVAVDPETLPGAVERSHPSGAEPYERMRQTIYGWACASDDAGVGVLHYAYVVASRRRHGLGRELVALAGKAAGRTVEQYSHSTITGARFCGALSLVSNPFAVIRMVSRCA